MAAFAYDAINAQGLELTGVIHAPDLSAAREQLQARGLLPQSLARAPAPASEARAPRVQEGQAEVAADLLAPARDDDRGRRQRRRGARRRSRSRPTTSTSREVIAEVRSDVEGGVILSKALARHPKVFNRLFVAMVEAGESSGTLDTVLDRVAIQIEKETQLKRRVKGAMVYPAVVIDVRDARAHLHAPLHRPGLRRRSSTSSTASCRSSTQIVDGHVERAARTTGSSSSPRSARSSTASAAQADRARSPALGSLQAQDPDEDRRRRPEDRARALLADALDARRRRRRHHQGARDHRRRPPATG